jgi:hypothetical protein
LVWLDQFCQGEKNFFYTSKLQATKTRYCSIFWVWLILRQHALIGLLRQSVIQGCNRWAQVTIRFLVLAVDVLQVQRGKEKEKAANETKGQARFFLLVLQLNLEMIYNS